MMFNANSKYMVDLFNIILKKSKIPKIFKIGKMIYFPKPNKIIKNPTDLRPITLTKGWCKIIESLFSIRLESELNKINFFESNQYGFIKNKSTVDAEIMVKEIKKSNEKKEYTVALSIDISGAFDGISWSLIMNNLIESNISNEFIKFK